MELQKIYIIGPAGSGKTFLAKKLQKKTNLKMLSLDDIFWQKKYTIRRNQLQQKKLLKKFLTDNQNNGWIIEGANPEFLSLITQKKPKIIWLNPNIFILIWQITKRQLTQDLGKSHIFSNYQKLIKGVVGYKIFKDNLYQQHKQCYEKFQ